MNCSGFTGIPRASLQRLLSSAQEVLGAHPIWPSLPIDITLMRGAPVLVSAPGHVLQQAELLSQQSRLLRVAVAHAACLQLATRAAAAAVNAASASVLQRSYWRHTQPQVGSCAPRLHLGSCTAFSEPSLMQLHHRATTGTDWSHAARCVI